MGVDLGVSMMSCTTGSVLTKPSSHPIPSHITFFRWRVCQQGLAYNHAWDVRVTLLYHLVHHRGGRVLYQDPYLDPCESWRGMSVSPGMKCRIRSELADRSRLEGHSLEVGV